jgi:6-phosphogluconolactonase (cycloisomerase 2 family)
MVADCYRRRDRQTARRREGASGDGRRGTTAQGVHRVLHRGRGPGLATADRDPGTGALTLGGASDDLPDPSYLALSEDRGVLYAVSETTRGAVAAYRVTGDLPVRLGPPVPVGGSGPTHLSLFAGHVLSVNYS